MQDGIIKGTGNSRYLKSIQDFLTQYPTYEAFVQALVAGTLPIDLNGINETGWDHLGTALNKANLLSDETASALGLPNTAVPDDAFSKIGNSLYGGSIITHTLVNRFTATQKNQKVIIDISDFNGVYLIDTRTNGNTLLQFMNGLVIDQYGSLTTISSASNTVTNQTRAPLSLYNGLLPPFYLGVLQQSNVRYVRAMVPYYMGGVSILHLFGTTGTDNLQMGLTDIGDSVSIYK